MTDDNTISVGEYCIYSYDNDNKSLSIVEVVEEFSDEVLGVKFLQVIIDDSGNGLFTYLHKTARTMNVSKKYLHKILLINRQKAEIEALIAGQETLQKALAEKNAEVERLSDRNHKCIYLSDDETTEYCVDGPCPKFKTESQIKTAAIKEFAEKYKERLRDVSRYDYGQHAYYMVGEQFIDNLVKEMVDEKYWLMC